MVKNKMWHCHAVTELFSSGDSSSEKRTTNLDAPPPDFFYYNFIESKELLNTKIHILTGVVVKCNLLAFR